MNSPGAAVPSSRMRLGSFPGQASASAGRPLSRWASLAHVPRLHIAFGLLVVTALVITLVSIRHVSKKVKRYSQGDLEDLLHGLGIEHDLLKSGVESEVWWSHLHGSTVLSGDPLYRVYYDEMLINEEAINNVTHVVDEEGVVRFQTPAQLQEVLIRKADPDAEVKSSAGPAGRRIAGVLRNVCFMDKWLLWLGELPRADRGLSDSSTSAGGQNQNQSHPLTAREILPVNLDLTHTFYGSVFGGRFLVDQIREPHEWLMNFAIKGKLQWFKGTTAFMDPPFVWLNIFHYMEAHGFVYSIAKSTSCVVVWTRTTQIIRNHNTVTGLLKEINRLIVSTNYEDDYDATPWTRELDDIVFDKLADTIGILPVHSFLRDKVVCFERLITTHRGWISFWLNKHDAYSWRDDIWNKLSIRRSCKKRAVFILIVSHEGRRAATNEAEIVKLVRYDMGLQTTVAKIVSGMPINVQIGLFASADIIIGSCGASLTNIVFAREHSSLIMYCFPGLHENDWLLDSVKDYPKERQLPHSPKLWMHPFPLLAQYMGISVDVLSLPRNETTLRETTSSTEEHISQYGNVSLLECEKDECYRDVLNCDFSVDMNQFRAALDRALVKFEATNFCGPNSRDRM